MNSTEIRSNTVLPARREPVVLHTDDGLNLVGELALPAERAPVATLVTLHPLPTAGGFMDSHLLRKAAFRLPALAELAILRFNTRGTVSPQGTSDGYFEEGVGEALDLGAAVDFVVDRSLPRVWLWGWSFGTDLVLKYGCLPEVDGAILVSPPLRYATDLDLDVWASSGKPMVVMVPEFDDYLQPEPAQRRFARVPQAEVVPLVGAKHLCVGEQYVSRVLNEIAMHVAPQFAPLPATWDEPGATGAAS